MANFSRSWTQPFHPAVLGKIDVPELFKTAAYESTGDVEKLPDAAFGLVAMEKEATYRLFPIHTAKSTWEQGQYLNQIWEGMPKTAAALAAKSIIGAANVYGVDVPKQLVKVARLVEDKKGMSRYYMIKEGEAKAGESAFTKTAAASTSIKIASQNMPIDNVSELGAAEAWFDRNHTKLAYAEKYKLACFIDKRRSDFKKEKTASYAYESPTVTETSKLNSWNPRLMDELLKRASFCREVPHANAYVQAALNTNVIKLGGIEAGIDFVENLDKVSGLAKLANYQIPDPVAICAVHDPSVQEKKAGEDAEMLPAEGGRKPLMDSSDMDFPLGKAISVGELKMGIKSGVIGRILGPSLTASLERNPAMTYSELPPPIRRLIVYQLRKQ